MSKRISSLLRRSKQKLFAQSFTPLEIFRLTRSLTGQEVRKGYFLTRQRLRPMKQNQNQKRLSQSPQRTQRKLFVLVLNPENHLFFASLAPLREHFFAFWFN